jgi:integrase
LSLFHKFAAFVNDPSGFLGLSDRVVGSRSHQRHATTYRCRLTHMTHPFSVMDGEGQPSPLEQLGRDYINHCRARRLSGKTIDQIYRPQLERLFLPWCQREGLTGVEQINQRALDRFAAGLLEQGGERKAALSPHTVSSYLRTVNGFLSWARSEGERVTARARLPKTPQRIVETLTRDEIATMEKVGNERDALIVRLLADTGIRAGELAGLRLGDLIEHERTDYIRVRGKGDKERLVPVPAPTAKRLRRLMRARPAEAANDRVFLSLRRGRSGEYEPLLISGLEQMIRELARQAGIRRRVWPHMFRHTYITFLLQQGVDATKIRRVVGHSSTQLIDRVYGHLLERDLADSVLTALTSMTR